MANPSNRREVIRRVLVNTISNYAGKIVGLGAWFLLTPFILYQLGDRLYGLWILVGSVVAYGTLLDLGISSALTKYVAEFQAKKDDGQTRALIATAVWLYAAMGSLVVVGSIALAPFFPVFFDVDPEERQTAVLLVILVGVGVGISIPCTTPAAVLRGLQRFDLINLLGIIGTLLGALGTVIVLLLGSGVIGLALVNIAAILIIQIPSVWYIYRIAPELRFGLSGGSRQLVRTVATFSSSLFIMNLGGHFESKTDEIVIGASLPIDTVTPYNLARRLSSLPLVLAEQFLSLLLPLASKLHAEDNRSRVRSLYIISTRLTIGIFVSTGIGISILAGPILGVWVGEEYAVYGYLVLILILASLIDTVQWPAGFILQGMNRHAPLAIMTIGSGIANLLLSIFLVRSYGLAGVAFGTLIPTTIVNFCFVMPYAMKVIGIRLRAAFSQIFLPALAPVVPAALAVFALSTFLAPLSIGAILLLMSFSAIVYLLGYIAMPASQFERELLFDFISNIFHSVKTYSKRA